MSEDDVMTTDPLPVCDYTGDDETPCEEPAVQRRWSGVAVVVSAALGAVAGGLLVAGGLVWGLGLIPGIGPLNVDSGSTQQSAKPSAVTISARGADADISEAVAVKAVPSVVSITTMEEGLNPFTGQTVSQEAGSGSGVIIRSDGHILTNNHVIKGASKIMVNVGVDTKVATVVGVDASSDLAVLSIEGTGYPTAEFGSSSDLKVGQYVMAVGSPFGLEKTVTAGIVSALNRSDVVENATDITAYTNLIQTDAAINPGNSGGALVDEEGRLVGINTLIQSTSGSSAGIGFAIPVDFARDIAEQIITSGKASHPYLGVSTETLNENIASQYSLPVSSGALVRFVQPASPAQTAGIKQGDIIVRIGEQRISGVDDVFTGLRANRVGQKVEVEVVRGESRRTVTVTLGSDADRQ